MDSEIDRRIREKLSYEENKNIHCPVCGYYCLGKGGVGCIDKPTLCGLNKNDTKNNRSK